MFKEIFISLMEKNNITAYKLSKDTGIPDSLLSNYRTGKKTPSSNNLIILAQYFNVSTDYLLGTTDEPNMYTEPTKNNDILTDEEKELLSLYRQMSDDNKKKLSGYMDALSDYEAAKNPTQKNIG